MGNLQTPRDENGKLHGELSWYLNNGQLDHRLNYIHGIRHGFSEWYYDDGKLRCCGHYYQDKEIGYWYDYGEKQYYLCLI